MAKINTFEEIEAWKAATDLAVQIYAITNYDQFSKDYSLKDQIRRCAISVPSNIAEGFERESTNSFIYFLLIAKGSCGELRTQLTLAKRLNYITEEQANQLIEECKKVSRLLSGFISYLRSVRAIKPKQPSNLQNL